jgi:glycosyltransferase involved in cell wall biosynthesis
MDDINGIPNAVYISMVKDEEDIIYENLVWHFATGFRKFIIVDNNSTDQTPELIKRFAGETKNLATVIIIQDPIVVHNQHKIITAGYKAAHEIWPEVEWFFPVDADEFWIFSQDPKIALAKIPKNIDAVTAIRLRYYPSDDYATFPLEEKFWHKLHYRDSLWREFTPDRYQHFLVTKIFLRYSPNFSLASGNHFVIYKGLFSRGVNNVFTYFTTKLIY